MTMPDVQFAELDAEKIKAGVITGFEAAARLAGQTDFKLYPGDPRRLFLNTLALLIIQQNNLIDKTGKGNLLRYAGEDTIQDLGYLYGTRGDRLEPDKAKTTIRFKLSTARPVVTTIAAGTRMTVGNIIFESIKNLDIPRNALYGEVSFECSTPGPVGNGFLPGQINTLIDRHPFVESAENITESAGGADTEELEAYRARLREVPESFSVAGPDGAYIFWAKTANANIVDVAAWMPDFDGVYFKLFLGEIFASIGANIDVTDDMARHWWKRFMDLCRETGTGPGNVNVAPLLLGGELPTPDILNDVNEILSDKTKRPLTDFVHVKSPELVEYRIDLTYWINGLDATSATVIQEAVTDAVEEYRLWQRSKMGRHINPSELIRRVKTAGAGFVRVNSPSFQRLERAQVARETSVAVNYGGLEYEP